MSPPSGVWEPLLGPLLATFWLGRGGAGRQPKDSTAQEAAFLPCRTLLAGEVELEAIHNDQADLGRQEKPFWTCTVSACRKRVALQWEENVGWFSRDGGG